MGGVDGVDGSLALVVLDSGGVSSGGGSGNVQRWGSAMSRTSDQGSGLRKSSQTCAGEA